MGRYAKGMQKAICAMRIVNRPRSKPMALKKISVATAVTISGTIKGREIRPNDAVRSLNRPPRTIAVAASVAMVVDTVAAMIAMMKLLRAAVLNFSLSMPVNTSTYQRSEMPSQLVIDCEALKL